MAIVLRGKTECRICGEVLDEDDEICAFPALISNQADPLFELNDCAFHKNCFRNSPLSQRLLAILNAWEKKTESRECILCSTIITDPDDYFIFPYFGEGILHDQSFAQFHRSCLSNWSELGTCIEELMRLNEIGSWGGDTLDKLIEVLRK